MTATRVGIILPSLARSGPRRGITLPAIPATNPPLPTPARPTAIPSGDTVTIRWTAVAGATSYKVWRSPTGLATWTQVGPGVSVLSVSDAPGLGTWDYSVSAVSATEESPRSSLATATITAPPPLPPSVPGKPSVALAAGTVTVAWSAALGASQYAVWRRPQGTSTWTQVGFSITQLTLTDVPGVGTWEYSVSAVNAAGQSAKSTPSDPVTITSTPPPVNLTGNVTTIDDTTVQVAWTPAVAVEVAILEPGSSGFEVLYTGIGNTIATGEQAIYIGELTPGGSYSFRLTSA